MRVVENFVYFYFSAGFRNGDSSSFGSTVTHYHHYEDFEKNMQETVFFPKKELQRFEGNHLHLQAVEEPVSFISVKNLISVFKSTFKTRHLPVF